MRLVGKAIQNVKGSLKSTIASWFLGIWWLPQTSHMLEVTNGRL